MLTDFQKFTDVGIRGPLTQLKIHGSAQLFFAKLEDCAISCAAAIDCAAFVHHRGKSFCTFKRFGANLPALLPGKDLYLKPDDGEESVSSSGIRSSSSSSSVSVTPLSSQSWSNASRVYGVQSLLGVAEADVLRGFAMDCFRRQRAGERLTGASGSKRNASTTERVTLGDPSCRAGAMASLLSTAERVISELTGLPVHEGEEPLMLTHQRPGRAAAWLDGSRVHHDRINALRETREVTVLAYLSTVDDAEGGHTIFPTLRRRVDGAMDGEARAADGTLSTDATDEGEDTSVDLGAMARIVEATYHRGTRSLGCNECSMQAQVPPTADELRGEATVQRHAEAECKRALNGERHARSLAVRPQAGLAVVFWHVQADGSATDANMWHAGCVGRTGIGRVALQKFKTPMEEDARARLEQDARRWRQAWAEELASVATRRRHDSLDGGGAGAGRGREEGADDVDDVLARAEHIMNDFFDE